MATTYAPPLSHRSARLAYGQRSGQRSSYPLLLVVAAGVFVVSAFALVLSQSGVLSRTTAVTAPVPSVAVVSSTGPAAATLQLTPAEIDTVVAYARTMQPDDALVQVRPGVFAKRSNVNGIPLRGATVYYDVLPHQSFGPLRSGQVTEQQVNVISRQAESGSMVVVYTKK